MGVRWLQTGICAMRAGRPCDCCRGPLKSVRDAAPRYPGRCRHDLLMTKSARCSGLSNARRVTAISLSDSCSVHLVGATERAHSCIMRTMIIAAVLVLATPAVADDRISDREWAEVCSQITDRERAEACRRIKARFDRGEHFNPNWGKECGKHCLPADFDASFAPPLLFPRALLHVPHDTGFNENNGRRAPRVRWGWTR
jgi:hypothetical protein